MDHHALEQVLDYQGLVLFLLLKMDKKNKLGELPANPDYLRKIT